MNPSEIPIACTVAIIDTRALMNNERNSGVKNGPAHDAGIRQSRVTPDVISASLIDTAGYDPAACLEPSSNRPDTRRVSIEACKLPYLIDAFNPGTVRSDEMT